MGYVAVQGGQEAIKQSILLNEYKRVKDQELLDCQTIQATMKPLLDQVMSESSLYDEALASLAIKQAGGSMEESVFLLRAHRSTLPRLYYSNIVESQTMFVKRRISASFKDIPRGQVLGASQDFMPRFLKFDLLNESRENLKQSLLEHDQVFEAKLEDDNDLMALDQLPKVVDYLDQQGLLVTHEKNDNEPDDITKRSIRFPSTRSQRLQSLTRGQTGAVTSLGYAKIRQFYSHPNIGELRVGDMPVTVASNGAEDEDDMYYIGSFEMTEVESLFVNDVPLGDSHGQAQQKLVLGYGACFGQNETKAIAMSILDHALEYQDADHPTSDDEFVLYHIDTVESTGFISHLKLPHYVTFQSELDAIRTMDKKGSDSHE